MKKWREVCDGGRQKKRGGGGVIAQGYKKLPTNRVEHNIDEI